MRAEGDDAMIRRGVAPALAATAAALTLAACGGGSGGGGHTQAGSRAGGAADAAAATTQATVYAANCNVWSVLDESQRRALLDGLSAYFGKRIDQPEGRGPTLSDDEAEALIERFCKPSYAGAFKLYKIYGRAAAFGG
jgi:hypothetical protein